jgi:hypothetical protein
MNETPENAQNTSNGLWIPFTIIFIGIVISVVFAVQTLQGYRKPRPLLIRPSSVNEATELSNSLYKALYPLKLQGFGVEYSSEGSAFGLDLGDALNQTFGQKDKNIQVVLQKIDLSQNYDNNKIDCLNTALFNMLRKPDRNWVNSIYFSVCTQEKNKFIVYYSTDKKALKTDDR